jgi:hypothetical protein
VTHRTFDREGLALLDVRRRKQRLVVGTGGRWRRSLGHNGSIRLNRGAGRRRSSGGWRIVPVRWVSGGCGRSLGDKPSCRGRRNRLFEARGMVRCLIRSTRRKGLGGIMLARAGYAPPDFATAGADQGDDKNAGRDFVEQKTAHDPIHREGACRSSGTGPALLHAFHRRTGLLGRKHARCASFRLCRGQAEVHATLSPILGHDSLGHRPLRARLAQKATGRTSGNVRPAPVSDRRELKPRLGWCAAGYGRGRAAALPSASGRRRLR